jgi:ATP adenylyltransferase
LNGITRYGNGAYSLIGGDELSDSERAELLQVYRHRTSIIGSIKDRVHRCARSRCECCGAHEHQRALEVDPIVPRNHGGTGDFSNLQAVGFRSNAGKRDGCLPTQEVEPTSAARWPAAGCCWKTNWRCASPMAFW